MKALVLLFVCSMAFAGETKEPTIAVPASALRTVIQQNEKLRSIAAEAMEQRDKATEAFKACVGSRSA